MVVVAVVVCLFFFLFLIGNAKKVKVGGGKYERMQNANAIVTYVVSWDLRMKFEIESNPLINRKNHTKSRGDVSVLLKENRMGSSSVNRAHRTGRLA